MADERNLITTANYQAKLDEELRQLALLNDARKKRAHGDVAQGITASPVAGPMSTSDAETHITYEWHVIHAGKQLGPLSLAELVQEAVAGEIDADDLIQKTGGEWTKARDFSYLQQFLHKDSREPASQATLDKLGRFHGIWVSKKAIVIGGFALIGLVALAWTINNPDPPQVKATPGFSDDAPPTWEDLAPHFQRRIPDLDRAEMAKLKGQFEQGRNLALAGGNTGFADRVVKIMFPEVTLSVKSDRSGTLHGKVHNQTGVTLEKVKLSIRTARWERIYEANVYIHNNRTALFSVYVADSSVEVKSFTVLESW